MSHYDDEPTLGSVSTRLARIESRIVQLMMHLGLHPNERRYDQSPNGIKVHSNKGNEYENVQP